MPKVPELKESGYTRRMTGDRLGYTKEQIKEPVKRYHRQQRHQIQPLKKRDRPHRRPISTEEAYQRLKQLPLADRPEQQMRLGRRQ